VVSSVKISASNIVPFGRYKLHKFSWKTPYFAKNPKIGKFCDLHLSNSAEMKTITLFKNDLMPSPWKKCFFELLI
jgi:hypothetical protein